jgi:hypothetical protein
MTKKNTDLKISEIRKKSKQYDRTEQVEIPHGEYEGQTITFYPLFSDKKVEELFEDYSKYSEQLNKKEIKLSESNTMNLIYMLAIKKFTHFGQYIPDRLFANDKKNEGILDWLNHFANTGLIKAIMEDIFIQTEVIKLHEKIIDILGRSILTDNLMADAQERASQLEIKNRDLFESYKKKQDELIEQSKAKVENEIVN